MDINLELYRIFCEVAKNGNISKAAEKLFVSQSAVSQAIMQLEDKIGGRLFDRSVRGVTPTAEGGVLFSHIDDALLRIENAQAKFAEMKALRALPGVGRKTANCVLGNAFGLAEGVVVDTHVLRLSHRLGLSKGKSPEQVERDLMRLIPRKEWIIFSHQLIWHGRKRCMARRPDCTHCELQKLCPRIGVA